MVVAIAFHPYSPGLKNDLERCVLVQTGELHTFGKYLNWNLANTQCLFVRQPDANIFKLFVRHFCFALLTGLLAARVGAQAGFATSRTLGLGFGIDFGFFMTLNTIAIRFKYV